MRITSDERIPSCDRVASVAALQEKMPNSEQNCRSRDIRCHLSAAESMTPVDLICDEPGFKSPKGR
jgi:hypothetical protein